MTLNRVEPVSLLDHDDASTVFTANTPPETVYAAVDDLDPLADHKVTSSVPWPSQTFLIRSPSTGHLLTLRNGQVILASPGGHDPIRWACVETKGWLGFRNTGSGKYLGHDKHGKLCCVADRQQGWENFCARITPEGGYVLLMTHFERLWHVGIKMERGGERLAKLGDGVENGMVWEFVKV